MYDSFVLKFDLSQIVMANEYNYKYFHGHASLLTMHHQYLEDVERYNESVLRPQLLLLL